MLPACSHAPAVGRVSLRLPAARGAASRLRAAPPRPAAAARRFARATATSEVAAPLAPAITLTASALEQLKKLKAESKGSELCLRIGVKSGGCSGMSYVMDFIEKSTVDESDSVIDHPEGFQIVCDPKSLLYLFGMELGYSTQLIGGGFQFQNPNAESSCGCGKSFSA